MPKNTIKRLRNYLSNNTSSAIRSRAKNIFLTPEKFDIENCDYFFSYVGSAGYPYGIYVGTKNRIYTYCDCPYDYAGLCKHEVAAVNFVIELLKSSNNMGKPQQQSLLLTDEIDKQLQQRYLFLENHLLSESFVDALMKRYVGMTDYFALFEFKKVVDNKITLIVDDFSESRRQKLIHFKYDVKTQQLHFTYDEDLNIAYTIRALVKLVIVLGESFFNPAYKQQKISEYIQQHNIDERYLQYYDFILTKYGIQATSKVNNLQTKTDEITERLFNWSDEGKTWLAIDDDGIENNDTHGFGFCIEPDKHIFTHFDFFLFNGKYKKNTTELATTFKRIDDDNFINYFSACDENEQQMLMQSFALANSIHQANFDINVHNTRKAHSHFKRFIAKYKDNYPFYIKPKLHTTLVRKHIEPLTFSQQKAELCFVVKKHKDFIKIMPQIRIDDIDKTYQINSRLLLITPFFCIKDNATIHLFDSPKDYIYLHNFGFQKEINFPLAEQDSVFRNVIQPLSEQFVVDNALLKPKTLPANTALKKELYLSDFEEKYIVFKLGVRYGKTLVLTHSYEDIFDETTGQYLQRDSLFEEEYIDYFQRLHPDFAEQNGIFYLKPEQLIEDEWLLKTSQKLKQHDVEIFGAKDLKSFKYSLHKPSISMSVASDIDWFDVKLTVKFGNEQVSLKDIRKAVINRSKYIALKDGTLGMLPEQWLNKFAKYFKAGEVKDKNIKISNYQFNILDDLCEQLENTPKFLQDLQTKKQSLHNLKEVAPVAIPKSLKAQLRPYQQEGLNWLVFLHENNLGGCLADDMGLGKTLQTIALLVYLQEEKKCTKPSLIIAPTSLIFNWQQELKKFAPTLKMAIYTGGNRHTIINDFTDYDVIVTTYGTVLNDIEVLKEQSFNYIIADESQNIKNPHSKRYKAMRLLSADNRLALTGTPIENNTFDLYAQMNFINPGLLGSMAHFKSEFSDAIDKEKDSNSATLLHEVIYPFLLRRTKAQVANDLPEKAEHIIYCEMGAEQRHVYDAFKEKYRDFLLKKMKEEGENKSQMYVLQGLTKLRQICNSPQLLNEEESYTNTAVKLDVLLDNVNNIIAQGSKVLIFSQFTAMLALVQERLESENIAFEYLDGQTTNREERVDNFQNNDEIKAFLISLKAGGTGLNLTKAEYVFLLDPWWNPAVENQAIDRCYRIGQTKNVIAYRLICKDTIEEKILDLQSDKKIVSDSIIQIDNESKSFDSERVRELFG